MSAHRSPLQGLLQLSACLGVQVKSRKRQAPTFQHVMRFNAGSESNPDPHPVLLAFIRMDACVYCINIHADVSLLSSSGKYSWTDCSSLALTHRCWHIDRWAASCPLSPPLMVSTRMDGLIFLRYDRSSHNPLHVYSVNPKDLWWWARAVPMARLL